MAADKEHQEEVESPEIHFEPIIQLKPVEVVTMEEDEEELICMRAKLFRFDKSTEPPEWKERGTGNAKILRHKTSNLIRVLMRRDKTLKVCANHYVQPEMDLTPNCGSEKTLVWRTPADFSDDEAKPEVLAIRFANAENAQKWKEKFEEAQTIMKEAIPKHNATVGAKPPASETKSSGDASSNTDAAKTDTDKVADKLENLTVKEDKSDNKDSATETKDSEVNKTDDDKSTGGTAE